MEAGIAYPYSRKKNGIHNIQQLNNNNQKEGVESSAIEEDAFYNLKARHTHSNTQYLSPEL